MALSTVLMLVLARGNANVKRGEGGGDPKRDVCSSSLIGIMHEWKTCVVSNSDKLLLATSERFMSRPLTLLGFWLHEILAVKGLCVVCDPTGKQAIVEGCSLLWNESAVHHLMTHKFSLKTCHSDHPMHSGVG
jgi:hypothetical protein